MKNKKCGDAEIQKQGYGKKLNSNAAAAEQQIEGYSQKRKKCGGAYW